MDVGFECNAKPNDEWFTPPEIIKALGDFDLDPCNSIDRPWNTAKVHFTKDDDGLTMPWEGRVWLNPPYCGNTKVWMEKMADHDNGIALIYSRMDNLIFHNLVFPKASGIYFLQRKISFYHKDGTKSNRAGCGSCLISFGIEDRIALSNFKLLNGTFFPLNL